MLIKVDEFTPYILFHISGISADRTVQVTRVFKRMCCKWTVFFCSCHVFHLACNDESFQLSAIG